MRRSLRAALAALVLLVLTVAAHATPNGATVCTGVSTNYQTITCPDINEEFSNANNRGIIRLTNVTGTNTITADAAPYALTSYADGQHFSFKPAITNTGPATISINSIGGKALVKQNGSALSSGDLQASTIYGFRYYAADDHFRLAGPTTSDLVPGGGVTDGDKGDITVTTGVWNIDADTITTVELADASVGYLNLDFITGDTPASGDCVVVRPAGSGGTFEAVPCGGGGLASTDIDTSAELRAIMTDEIGTGVLVFLGAPADDTVPVGDSATATTWRALPDSDAAGVILGYDTATNTFSTKADDDVPEAGDFTALALTGDVTSSGLATTIAANSVALTTDTTGNYMLDVAAGTGIATTHTPAEGSTATIAFDFTDAAASPALTADQCRFTSNGTVAGNLVCEGDTADTIETRIAVTDPTTTDRTFTIPNADSVAVQPLTCSGSDKVSAISAAGALTCTADTGLLSTAIDTSAEIAAIVGDETGSGALVFATSPVLVTPNLGTPSAATLTNATGLPVSTGLAGLGTGVATALGTPSSANLRAAITDEVGTGLAMYGLAPTMSDDLSCTGNQVVRRNAGDTAFECATPATGLVTTDIDTSAELRTILTDEVGTGVLVFLGTPADDAVAVGDSVTATTWRTIPNVPAGSFLTYTTSTNSFGTATDDDVPDAADFGALALTGDVTSSGLATTIASNSVALTADTTGNYMVDVAAGVGIVVSHTPAEGSTATVDFDFTDAGVSPVLAADKARFTSNATVAGFLVFEGDTADAFETRIAITDPTADRTFTIPNADSAAVQPLTCSGTDKVSAISALGVITCTADSGGAGSGDNIRVEDGNDAGTYTAAIDADFGDSGDINFALNTGATPNEITATVRADSVALTTDTTGNYAAGDSEAGNALTGDSATAFFTTGFIEVARGGTGAAPGGDDQVFVSSSTTAGAWATLPDSEAAGVILGYDTTTNAFSTKTDDDVPDAADFGALALTGDVTSSGLATTIASNSVALTADTTGNYMLDIAAGVGMAVTHTPAEGSTATVDFDFSDAGVSPSLAADKARFTSNATVAGFLVFEGDTADAFESRIALADPTADRTFTIPNADSNPVQPLTCSGSDKVSAISAAGVITCSTDQTGAGGGDAIRVEDSNDAGTYTAATDADFGDSGDINFALNTGATPNEITATVRADSVALTTDTTGNYAAGDAEAGAALTGDSATAFFSTGTLELARGGTGASLTDPNADRLMFWDDSAGATAYLTPDATLSISTTNIGVVDVTCTGCLGSTEIAALDAGDVTTGTFSNAQLVNKTESFCMALSDETTAITTGVKLTMRVPYAFVLTELRASVNTVSTSGIPTIDITENGSTIMTTNKLTIDANEKTSETAATAAGITDANLADDAEMIFNVTTAGTGTKGLKVCMIGHQ